MPLLTELKSIASLMPKGIEKTVARGEAQGRREQKAFSKERGGHSCFCDRLLSVI